MRIAGILFAIGLHLALLLASMIVPYVKRAPSTPMMVLPVELMTLADTTNLAPIPDKTKGKAEAPAPVPATTTSAAAKPAPEPDAVSLPTPTPTPTPSPSASATPQPKKADAKKPMNDKEMKAALESLMKDVRQQKSTTSTPAAAGDITKVPNAAPRAGVGDQKRMTITTADFIRSQLISRGCWRGAADMPDADRLRATIRIRFARGGALDGPPLLVTPSRPPSNDAPLQVFIARAQQALRKCEPFNVPPQYFETSPTIDIDFLPGF